ncbi:D-sedoheptulose 7-phosphate isomerase [Solimonas aquatica]|uniref:D-sedoheptulose 7-phosphate isomerase n=1 Tax=Solimonas aquatica TaxID=489703 RepID=A0A1H9DHP1_9GAMM|nr:SIS domain-containing protein [Solimonas aquatica]SEQ13016.1 D-sedoheptulose 7-phosphate isomerase [Solimonas aquatica]
MSAPVIRDALQGLYPFLHGESQNPQRLEQALLESVTQKSQDSIETKRRFFAENGTRLVAAARALAEVYRRGGRLLCMGNGGSSCDAAHIAVEFQHPVTAGRPALPAMNLMGDTAMMTAVGNDVGFDQVFARQVIAHGRRGDALVGMSTSGNSDNLLNAFMQARKLGMTTIGFAGHDGGAMAHSPHLDHCLVVASDSIHRVQETHVACYHILWDLVHTLLADNRGSAETAS